MGRHFPPVQTGPGAHPAFCTMGTGSFPGVKYDRGVLLTTHPLLVPRSWKSRAIPLPTLRATTGPVTGTLYLYLYQSPVHRSFITQEACIVREFTFGFRHAFKRLIAQESLKVPYILGGCRCSMRRSFPFMRSW